LRFLIEISYLDSLSQFLINFPYQGTLSRILIQIPYWNSFKILHWESFKIPYWDSFKIPFWDSLKDFLSRLLIKLLIQTPYPDSLSRLLIQTPYPDSLSRLLIQTPYQHTKIHYWDPLLGFLIKIPYWEITYADSLSWFYIVISYLRFLNIISDQDPIVRFLIKIPYPYSSSRLLNVIPYQDFKSKDLSFFTNKEVKRAEPSPSARIPCLVISCG
jgi:hypothetical protein